MHIRVLPVLAGLILLAGAVAASARPNDPLTADPVAGGIPGSGKSVPLAEVWGEQLRPPEDCGRIMVNLVEAVSKWTNIAAHLENRVMLGTGAIRELPVIFLVSDRAFQLTEAEKKNLGEFVRTGGLIVADIAAGEQRRGQAEASFRKMIDDILGPGKLRPIPSDHPVYHSWFDFDGPPTGQDRANQTKETVSTGDSVLSYLSQSVQVSSRIGFRPFLEGASLDGRLAVLLSDRGYARKWSADSGNDPQLKLGVNLIVYAFQQKRKPQSPNR